ncbi:MAG: S26 family signal peptidase [Candidatus Omnitrophota bacterium]
MRPFLKAMDACITKKIPPSRLRSGDIIVYENAGDAFVAHRILNIDKDSEYVLVKGDNIPYSFRERVPFADIKGKVVAVERGNKVFNLERFPLKIAGKCLAFLSARDLTPLLFRKRFIDPILLGISRSPFYVFLRTSSYGDISFMCTKEGTRCHVYAFVHKVKSADALLELKEDGRVSVSSYIRYRDRNPVFEEKFNQKIQEVADKEFGTNDLDEKNRLISSS